MKKYFQLFEECILVYNSINEGAIYNLLSGDVFQYNYNETNILSLCEKKYSIEQVIELLNISSESVFCFLDKLEIANLGFYSDQPVYVEKMLIDYNWRELSFIKDRPVVEKAYILLNNSCKCNCIYCDENHIRMNGCIGCFKNTNNSNKETTVEEYFMALDKLKLLGVNTIFFSGGNFFSDFKKNIKIVNYAKNLFIKNIVLFLGSNQRVENEYLEELKRLDVDICIQVPVQDKESIYNNFLLNDVKGKLPFSVILVFDVMHDNAMKNNVIQECLAFYNPLKIYTDLTVDIKQINKMPKGQMFELRRTSIYDFNLSQVYNRCMNGLLSITANKMITVCPRINEPIGEIDNFIDSLSSEKLNKYWRLTKDKIKGCKGCNIRYICKDCRYIEMNLSGDLYGNQSCFSDLSK